MTILISAIALLLIIFFLKKKSASTEIHSKFGLNVAEFKLIGTDLGEKQRRFTLIKDDVSGIADAVFESTAGKTLVVGEYKSRKHRQIVKLHEFYQVMLYMGHLKHRYPNHQVIGRLAFADGWVTIMFDPAVYQGLLALKREYWDTVTTKRIVDNRPLHKRMRVDRENSSLKFSERM